MMRRMVAPMLLFTHAAIDTAAFSPGFTAGALHTTARRTVSMSPMTSHAIEVPTHFIMMMKSGGSEFYDTCKVYIVYTVYVC